MMQTLVWIPAQLAGWNVFGVGWLLVLWVVIATVVTVRQVRRVGWNDETWQSLPMLALVALAIVFLLPRLLEVSPAGTLGIPIRGFGVMLLLAIVAGVGLCVIRAKQVGLDPELIISLAFWMIVAGIVGARAFYVLEYWPKFVRPTWGETLGEVLNATKGGLVVYGSVIGGLIAGAIFLRRHRLPLWEIADIIAPGMILGQAIGRVGCFMNGCCYGGLCTLPFLAVSFPSESPAHSGQREAGLFHGIEIGADDQQGVIVRRVLPGSAAEVAGFRAGDQVQSINGGQTPSLAVAKQRLFEADRVLEIVTADGRTLKCTLAGFPPRSLPVHPTQLYSFVDAALLTFFLWCYYPYRRRPGEVFAWLITLHPISRLLLEQLRTDEPGQWGTSLTISQWLSMGFLIAAAALWWHLERGGTRAAQQSNV